MRRRSKPLLLSAGVLCALYFLMTATSPLTDRVNGRLLQEQKEEVVEDEEDEGTVMTTIMCIVLVLILLTVAFEQLKEYIEELAEDHMGAVLQKFFGELAVLGFLSVVSFCVAESGMIGKLSQKIFDDPKELLEYLEYAHYSLFMVMILFVVQMVLLVCSATRIGKRWDEMDRICRSEDSNPQGGFDGSSVANGDDGDGRRAGGAAAAATEQEKELVLFRALRDEFILERSPDFPFEPAPVDRRLNADFDFGRYLFKCLIDLLEKVVNISIVTWIVFAFGTCLFWAFSCAVRYEKLYLAIAWLVFGYAVFTFYRIVYLSHLTHLLHKMIPKSTLRHLSKTQPANDKKKQSVDESKLLLTEKNDSCHDHLPSWCHANFYQERWCRCKCSSGSAHPFHDCFWLGRSGPYLYAHLLQSGVLFTGIYTGILLLFCFGTVLKQCQLCGFIVYLIISILPFVFVGNGLDKMLSSAAQVCSVGAHRKPQIVSAVLREQKTVQVVRAFMIAYRFRRLCEQSPERMSIVNAFGSPSRSIRRSSIHYSQYVTSLEINEACKAFDTIDIDGSGTLVRSECVQLLAALLGASEGLNKDGGAMIDKMMAKLDKDGDGEISKDEFLQWYFADHSMTKHERAKALFDMFDHNHVGEITMGEFKNKLDSFPGVEELTVDEIGAIVNELDRDRNGSVSLEEFEYLLDKYYPEELKREKPKRH